jgi:hypothetical protein
LLGANPIQALGDIRKKIPGGCAHGMIQAFVARSTAARHFGYNSLAHKSMPAFAPRFIGRSVAGGDSRYT